MQELPAIETWKEGDTMSCMKRYAENVSVEMGCGGELTDEVLSEADRRLKDSIGRASDNVVTQPEWVSILPVDACRNAILWSSQFSSPQDAWDSCQRADWMAWLAGKLRGERGDKLRKRFVLCLCECLRTSCLKLIPDEGGSPLRVIEEAESWARGEHDDIEKVRDAYSVVAGLALDESHKCSASESWRFVKYNAYNAVCMALSSAYEAPKGFFCVVWASRAVAANARQYKYVSSFAESLSQMSEIIRRHYPKVPL